jgi:transcriptional regulator with XRE-family HTH domain
MKVFDKIMDDIRSEMKELSFHEILRQSRDGMGLMQYRTAEFLGMRNSRLKNLETGFFRSMPLDQELDAISDFFELPREMLEDKAARHVRSRRVDRKVRTLGDG